MLRIAGSLHRGESPEREDILACLVGSVIGGRRFSRTEAWNFLIDKLRTIVEYSDLMVVPFPPSEGSNTPRIRLLGSGLYPALVTELMFAVL
jgi:hypothetical protein